MAVETDAIIAYHNRLAGADAHEQALKYNGEVIPVYTGNASTAASAPYTVVGRPRTRGAETIDGVTHPELRIQLRVHTAFPEGKGNHAEAYEIAQAAHDLLEAAPITIGGKEPYVPEPDFNPIPSYEKGDQEALDVSAEYVFPSL